MLTRWLSQGLCDLVAVEHGHHQPLWLGPMFPGCGPRRASLSHGTTRLHLWSQGLLLLRPQDEEGAASSSAAAPDLCRPGPALCGAHGAGWGWAPTAHARIPTAELRFPPSSASLLLFPSQVFFQTASPTAGPSSNTRGGFHFREKPRCPFPRAWREPRARRAPGGAPASLHPGLCLGACVEVTGGRADPSGAGLQRCSSFTGALPNCTLSLLSPRR